MKNTITNIFGTVSGVPMVIAGITHIQNGQYPDGIAMIAAGIGAFVVAYFVGKNNDGTSKSTEQVSKQQDPQKG